MATSLAEHRKLLRATPAALYEVATAAVIAVNLAPQLLSSLQRIRLARKFRGLDTKWWRFGSLLVPVLEDTIERSLKLAASMDARGFGRIGNVPRRVLVTFQLLSFLSLCFFASATYLILATDQEVWVSLILVALGLCSLAFSLRLAGLAKLRTKYPGRPLGYPDFLVLICCVLGLFALANAAPGSEGLLQWNP
jgi:energy-coupling factor transport system permease protein